MTADKITETPHGNELQRQLTRNSITELKARYCRFLDCKRWQDIEDDLFT